MKKRIKCLFGYHEVHDIHKVHGISPCCKKDLGFQNYSAWCKVCRYRLVSLDGKNWLKVPYDRR